MSLDFAPKQERKNRLHKLVLLGLVQPDGKGDWELTDEGHEIIGGKIR
ncbi:hypothetical protein [Ulvibacterium marinum]|nr:hypothetical protein [Ulvibacterium marinum]